jgi:thiosulfate dehydrogenase [quinone] large subunit
VSLADYFLARTRLLYLAIPRIAVGYHFVSVALPKLSRGFTNGNDLPGQLMRGIGKDPIAMHRAFIEGFVLPHSAFFSYLVPYGELAIGISLLFGCLVRVSSAFGAFHNLNILLAVAMAGGSAQIAVNATFIALHVVFVLSSAGRSLGLDYLLKRMFPKSPLF